MARRMEIGSGRVYAPAQLISRRSGEDSSEERDAAKAKKKRIGWEGARRSAGLRGNKSVRRIRGLGGKIAECAEPNHRGSMLNMMPRCGSCKTITGPNRGEAVKAS